MLVTVEHGHQQFLAPYHSMVENCGDMQSDQAVDDGLGGSMDPAHGAHPGRGQVFHKRPIVEDVVRGAEPTEGLHQKKPNECKDRPGAERIMTQRPPGRSQVAQGGAWRDHEGPELGMSGAPDAPEKPKDKQANGEQTEPTVGLHLAELHRHEAAQDGEGQEPVKYPKRKIPDTYLHGRG